MPNKSRTVKVPQEAFEILKAVSEESMISMSKLILIAVKEKYAKK